MKEVVVLVNSWIDASRLSAKLIEQHYTEKVAKYNKGAVIYVEVENTRYEFVAIHDPGYTDLIEGHKHFISANIFEKRVLKEGKED